MSTQSYTTPTVTDSKGNTWTIDGEYHENFQDLIIASTRQDVGALTTSDTVTITTTANTSGQFLACLQEFSGIAVTSYVDGAMQTNHQTTSPQLSPIYTPTADGDLIIAMQDHQTTTDTVTINGTGTVGTYSSFTTAQISGTTARKMVPVYQILSSGNGVGQKHAWTTSSSTWSDIIIGGYKKYAPPATNANAGVASARVDVVGAFDVGELIHYVKELANGENTDFGVATTSIPLTASPLLGNTLVLVYRTTTDTTGTRSMAVTDSQGNTWTIDSQDIQGSQYAFIASTRQDVARLTTSDTITVTLTGSTHTRPTFYWVEEFRNLAEADSAPTPIHGDTTSPYVSPAIVPNQNGDMAVAYIDHFSNTDTLTNNATGTVGTYASFDTAQMKSTTGGVTTGSPVYQVLGLTEGASVSQFHAWSGTSNVWSNMLGVAYKRVIDSTNASAGVAQATASGKSPTDTLTCSPIAGVAAALVGVSAPSLGESVEVVVGVAEVEAAAGNSSVLVTSSPEAGLAEAGVGVDAPQVTSSASVQVAQATGAAEVYDPSVTVVSNVEAAAGVATAVVTTAGPGSTLTVSPDAGGATATAAAIGVTTALLDSPDAGAADTTGSALDPTVAIGARAGSAAAATAVEDPVSSSAEFPDAGSAATSAAAYGPTIADTLGVDAGAASVAADSYGPSPDLDLASPADNAEATAAAYSPTVATSATNEAPAGTAAVTATAAGPTVTDSASPNAVAAEVSALALGAMVSAASNISASLAQATAVANAPTLTETSNAHAGVAAVTVSTKNPTPALAVTAGSATVAGQSLGATAALVDSPAAGTAEVAGTAYGADVEIVGMTNAHAGVASSSASVGALALELTCSPEAGAVEVEGVAGDPTISNATRPNPGTAQAVGEALGAMTTGVIQPSAGNVTTTASAHGAFAAVGAQAGVAEAVVEVEGVSASTVSHPAPGRAAVTSAAFKPTVSLHLSVSAGVAEAVASGYAPEVISGYSVTAGRATAAVEVEDATTFGTLDVDANASGVIVAAALDPRVETATVFHLAHAGCAIAGCMGFDVTKGSTPDSRRVDIVHEDRIVTAHALNRVVDIPAKSRSVTIAKEKRVDPIDPEVREVFAYVVSNGGS
jgi:hypothetical protein